MDRIRVVLRLGYAIRRRTILPGLVTALVANPHEQWKGSPVTGDPLCYSTTSGCHLAAADAGNTLCTVLCLAGDRSDRWLGGIPDTEHLAQPNLRYNLQPDNGHLHNPVNMNITIVPIGSRGDLVPSLPISIGLGQQVRTVQVSALSKLEMSWTTSRTLFGRDLARNRQYSIGPSVGDFDSGLLPADIRLLLASIKEVMACRPKKSDR